jgi:hypothetical protein
MIRRLVALVLTPCVLLSQTVLITHAHASASQLDHDLLPHFHTQSMVPDHSHHHLDNDLDDDSNHLHHGLGGDEETEPEIASESQSEIPHDHDAVYINSVDSSTNNRAATAIHSSVFWNSLPVAPYAGTGPTMRSASMIGRTHGPPRSCRDHPLYLDHLALLI